MIGNADELKEWARGKLDNANADALDRVLNAATSYIARRTGRLFTESSHTIHMDGDRAGGRSREILRIPKRYSPVAFSGMTVTENGTSLTLAEGYDTAVDVIVADAGNEERACRLMRRPSTPMDASIANEYTPFVSWIAGRQNVTVAFTAGWDTVTSPNVPADLVQAAYEIAWLTFSTPAMMGKASAGRAGSSVSFDKKLTDVTLMTLDQWTAR